MNSAIYFYIACQSSYLSYYALNRDRTNCVRKLYLTLLISQMFWKFYYPIFLCIFNIPNLNFSLLSRIQGGKTLCLAQIFFLHLISSHFYIYFIFFRDIYCVFFNFILLINVLCTKFLFQLFAHSFI